MTTTRIVFISDTHCYHARVAIPDGDIVVHCGDFCSSGKAKQARSFARFFQALPHRHKVVIAGNHDICLEDDPMLGDALFESCHYLMDSGAVVDGVRFWGSPWQPWFLDWAFNLQRGAPLRDKWALIPNDTDVLLTHGPPYGVLDRTTGGELAGCEELLLAVRSRQASRACLRAHSRGLRQRAPQRHVARQRLDLPPWATTRAIPPS